MSTDLSTLVSDLQSQLDAGSVSEADATLDDIRSHYADRRRDDAELAMRARIGDFENDDDVQAYLGTYLTTSTVRSGFLSTAALAVDEYGNLETEGELDALLTELSNAADRLTTLESDLANNRDAAAPTLNDADLPASVELLLVEAVGNAQVASGDIVKVDVVTANVGDATAEGVDLVIEPSSGLVGSYRTESIGPLDAGVRDERTIEVEVDDYGVDNEQVRCSLESENAGVATGKARVPRADERPDDGIGPAVVGRLEPTRLTIDAGASFEASATVTNEGTSAGDVDVRFTFDDSVEASTTLSNLAVETPTEVTFAVDAPPEGGSYELGIETDFDAAQTTLTVDPVEPPSIEDYAGDDGRIHTDGLRNAVDDWRSELLDTATMQEVIDLWSSGDPVSDG